MSRAGTLPTKVTLKVAVLAPAVVGTNSKPIEQLAPGCMTPPFTHAVWPAATVALLKLATCPVLGFTAGFPSVMAVPALLLRTTPIGALVAPTAVLGNATGLGVAVGVGSGANGGGGGGVIATTR